MKLLYIMRTIFLVLITLYVLIHLLKTTIKGLKTGKIIHTNDRVCYKSKTPIKYWLIVSLFLFFIFILLFMLYKII